MYDPSPSGITMVMDAEPERLDPRLTENLTDFMSDYNEISKKENRRKETQMKKQRITLLTQLIKN